MDVWRDLDCRVSNVDAGGIVAVSRPAVDRDVIELLDAESQIADLCDHFVDVDEARMPPTIRNLLGLDATDELTVGDDGNGRVVGQLQSAEHAAGSPTTQDVRRAGRRPR